MSILSIYCSGFNLENGLFDWQESLDRFYAFGDELCIGTTNDCKDKTIELLQNYISDKPRAKLVITDFLCNGRLSDGQIKNAALQATTLPAKVMLDLDEVPVLSQKQLWIDYYNQMVAAGAECLMIPSINLCGDIYHYKDIAHKFYLHMAGLNRGVVNYAKKENEIVDIKLSDGTEILNKDGNLPKIVTLSNDINMLKQYNVPYVFHKWGIDLNKRIGQNKFRKPIWEEMAGRQVDDVILDKKDIENIEVFEHGLLME